MINLKKLYYFLTVAKEGQITSAAKKLCISQPPLTAQLKKFEEELGVQLIKKVGRNIKLTEAGEALYEKGNQIVELVTKTQKEIKDIDKGEVGTLSIAAVTALGATFLPEQILNYSQKYPKISFRIYDADNHMITNLLTNGVIEIGIVLCPVDTTIYDSIPLPTQLMVAAMHPKWNQHPTQNSVTLKELSDKPLILHRSSDRIRAYYEDNNLNPNIICLHNDIRSMISLSSTGLGIAIIPKTSAVLNRNKNLIYKEVSEPILPLYANIIWSRNRYLSNIAKNFLEMLQNSPMPLASKT